MADAGGTNTVVQIGNEGPYMKYVVYNTSADNAETIPIDGTNGVPGIQAEDKVIVVGGMNFSDETALWGATFTGVEYDETNMHFTLAGSMSGDDIAIVFIYIPQSDPFLGAA